VLPVASVTPEVALVWMPSGCEEPVPVVKWVFWIRPIRVPRMRARNSSTLMLVSWRNW
jgi:hypothetical protein